MSKNIIATASAPAAVGPYSQAIRLGNMIYTSGQIGLDPETGEMVAGESPEETIVIQTRQVLTNLSAVLAAAGSGLEHVVKTTVFLRAMKDFATMNGVYAEFFGDTPPARSTIGVAALPLGARVEIEAVAFVPAAEEGDGGKKKDKKEKKGKKK